MIMYGDDTVYGQDGVYNGLQYEASWIQSYEFTYVAGVTVYVTADLTATIPVGSTIELLAGQAPDELEPIFDGVESAVTFTLTSSGLTNLYVKIVLATTMYDAPIVDILSINVRQETSLFTLANTVLLSGTDGTGISYTIDPWLRNVLIPYAWFRPVRHRFALKQIAEAVGGVVFCDRYGKVTIEAAGYLTRENPTSMATIGQDKMYNSSTPVSDIRNIVSITTQPWTIAASQTVWTFAGTDTLQNGQSKTYEVFFNDFEAVLDAEAVLTSNPVGATITNETWYDWGGRVTILANQNDQAVSFTVTGEPLVIVGARILQSTDTDSVRRNGPRELIIDENRFIQSATIAQVVADEIVSITGVERRDLEIDWRGDPTIELGDRLTTDGIHVYNVGQTIMFDGILSSNMRLRRA